MTRLSPRERRQARTREEILAAALEIISDKGPDNFTLRTLAGRVDYSPAALYEYFDSKDDIIEAVCAEGDRRLQAFLRAVPADLPAADYLVELGLAYVQFAENNSQHFLLMFTNVERGPTIPYEEVQREETYGILLAAVQTAIDAGLFAVRPGFGRDEIAYSLWAIAHGQAMLHLTNLHRIDYDFSTADRLALEAFIRGLSQ